MDKLEEIKNNEKRNMSKTIIAIQREFDKATGDDEKRMYKATIDELSYILENDDQYFDKKVDETILKEATFFVDCIIEYSRKTIIEPSKEIYMGDFIPRDDGKYTRIGIELDDPLVKEFVSLASTTHGFVPDDVKQQTIMGIVNYYNELKELNNDENHSMTM